MVKTKAKKQKKQSRSSELNDQTWNTQSDHTRGLIPQTYNDTKSNQSASPHFSHSSISVLFFIILSRTKPVRAPNPYSHASSFRNHPTKGDSTLPNSRSIRVLSLFKVLVYVYTLPLANVLRPITTLNFLGYAALTGAPSDLTPPISYSTVSSVALDTWCNLPRRPYFCLSLFIIVDLQSLPSPPDKIRNMIFTLERERERERYCDMYM